LCDASSRSGLPVIRALTRAFTRDRLAWPFEEQFLCGDCILVAPVKRPGGSVEVYLPRGDDWIDLDTGARHAGGALLQETVALDRLPHFGRVGHVLPLGPVIDRADAMDPAAPLDEAWAFGEVTVPRTGFTQLRFHARGERYDGELEGGRIVRR
jgi:alpha-glucosidase (family GH31 glycosyl hydrolase)